MSEKIKITFNCKEIEVAADQTILQVAKSQRVDIPTFCYDDRLKPFASCFVCVVEVERAKTLLPACSTKVMPGMVIQTNSEKVMKTRKMALDLMLSDHAGDCEAPCKNDCPARTDVQGYVAHIANGEYDAAMKLIKSKLALPLVCGTICPNPCEAECRRGLVDDPIAIRALKRFAADYDLEHGPYLPEVGRDTGKKIKIVGGGPAGLAAAYYLRQIGHAVDLYEALPSLGGMTRYGIPKFRLPWDKLDAEIKSITDLGVNVHLNKKMGVDFTLDDIRKDSDAVLIAVGSHASKSMRVENENVPGVMGGVEFLRKVVLGEDVQQGKTVAVIGGGDVAMDCARVAKRLGTDVTLLYRRTQKEMPALQHEQDETIEEGVTFRYLSAPLAVISDDSGKAKYLRVQQMELGEPDDSGRRRPVPVEGSEENLAFDLIISAIGQDTDLSCLDGTTDKPELTRWKTFIYDEKNMTTPIAGVFSAGDCAFGPNTVVQALAEGRTAALSIDMYLNGADIHYREEYAISRGRKAELSQDDFAPRFSQKRRETEEVFPAEKRLSNGGYAAINLKLEEAQTIAEASRCIECGCNARYDCDLRKYATEYDATEKRFTGEKRDYPVDFRHPLIRFEADKCITCGSCVRVCSEYRDISALCFVDRGYTTHIAPAFEDSLQKTNCDACGMCIDVCPTGAISGNTSKESGPWPSVETLSTCTSCGNGCAINVHTVEGKVRKVESVGDGYICAEGRFNYLAPKKLEEVGDLKLARKIIKSSRNLLVVVSPWLTVEEIFTASQFCYDNDGTLFYQPASQRSQSKYPYSKTPGLANVSLLKRLGAKELDLDFDEDSSDCIVMIGSYLPLEIPEAIKDIKIVALSNHPVGPRPRVVINVPNALSKDGAYLNSNGELAFLQSQLHDEKKSISSLLSQISEAKEGYGDIQSLREQLVKVVPELHNLLTQGSKRVVETGLKPVNAVVMADAKEVAFAQYLKNRKVLKSFLHFK